MDFSKKDILLISPEPWGKSHVSKHHYALELAKSGAKVFFLNAPSDKFLKTKVVENLYAIDYKPKYRGIAKLPAFLSALLITKEVRTLQKLLAVDFDVIWNFDTSRFFNLNGFKNKLCICHIVDMAENHQRELLAKTSDICFCTSDYIKRELTPFNNKVFKIHHGYQSQPDLLLDHSFVKDRIQVGIVGNLSRSCMDWGAVLNLIKKYPFVDFNFIGSYKTSNLSRVKIDDKVLEELESYTNCHLIGQVESHKIPSYLTNFDVLLCAYKIENEVDIAQHSNLHKTMEYLGSGKVIVSSYVDEYKNNEDLLLMAKPFTDISNLFDKAIDQLDVLNSLGLQQKRVRFAKDHSYENQLRKMCELIANHG